MENKDTILDNNKTTISSNSKEKEYLYDSLCYRYIRAREHMAEWEYERDNHKHGKDWYYENATRDMMRFFKILNEAIGEHN